MAPIDAVTERFTELTDRERLIALKWAEGLTYRDIAEQLFIAPSTVRSHLKTVYRKLGIHNKSALVALLSQLETHQTRVDSQPQHLQQADAQAHDQDPNWAEQSRVHIQRSWIGLALVLLVAVGIALVIWTQNWQAEEQHQKAQALAQPKESAREPETSAESQAQPARMAFPLPSEPSIAVLPFMNLSDDAEQAYFVDGITNDIITDLSRFSTLFVIAATSTFRYKGQAVKVQQVAEDLGVRYVLEGSVQRLGDTLRINAQLIDALSGRHVWAERYDRNAQDLFAIQNEITRNIVGVISPLAQGRGKLRKVELQRIERTPTESLQAYDYFVKALYYKDRSFTKADNELSKQIFKKAIELDPGFGRAFAIHTWNYLLDYWNAWSDEPEASLQRAVEVAKQGVAADPNEGWTHFALASAYMFQKRHDLAIRSYEQAYALNPNDANIVIEYGWGLSYAGRSEEGILLMEKAFRLNPYHPGYYWALLSDGYFVVGDYQNAIANLEKLSQPYPLAYRRMAASYAQLGQMQKAQEAMAKYRELEPQATLEQVAATTPFKRPEDLQRFVEGLRKAGMPEGPSPAATTLE